jgi:hypothetical protein
MALVKQLKEFIGIHRGQKIVVCGCGISLLGFKDHHHKFITIGVNDVPALFDPTYSLVTDQPSRFLGKRRDLVNQSRAKHLFTCAKGWRHKNIVHFELGSRDIKHLDSHHKVDHFVNSPFVGVNLAYKLGASAIGIIGVDFTDGHFYNPNDGAHSIVKVKYFNAVNSSYQKLWEKLNNKGVPFYNLSQISRLDVPKITIENFEKL